MNKPILSISDVHIEYASSEKKSGSVVTAHSLTIAPHERVGIVGESGSGKTTIVRAILGLTEYCGGRRVHGSIQYHGDELCRKGRRVHIGYIPQNPHAAFDPLFMVQSAFHELLREHDNFISPDEWSEKIAETLAVVGLDESVLASYPHQLSGGMKQRLLIALAIIAEPALIIADEPTSNLDMVSSANVLSLFQELRERLPISFLVATHDISFAKEFCDRIYVMHEGRIVEHGAVEDIILQPQHAYTQSLMQSMAYLAGGPYE